jgi:tetratricopeptide (TPR) repeat protein
MLRPAARGVVVLSIVTIAALLPAIAAAQGHVAGTVRDAAGHPIKGATITAENPNFAFKPATSTSDAKGRYSFLGLRGGTWTFTVQAPGFLPQKRQAATRAMGTDTTIDFQLQAEPDAGPPGPLANVDARALQQQLAKASQLEEAGQLDAAIAAYREILQRVPALTTVHLQLGVLFERQHDATSAIAEYQAALKGDPSNAKARAALDRLARQ